MKSRLPLVAWAGVWVVLVVLSTTAVWWAISRAGSHVTSMAAPQLPASSTAAVPSPTTSSAPASTRPPTSARPSTPNPPRSSSPPATPRADPTRTRTPTTQAVQRSWRGTAGRVTATCRGERISLDAAVPADGYAVDIEGRGPESLEVEFHQTRGEDEAKVRGTCRAGEPQFFVERD